jgi:hypothetical protein
VPVNGGQATTNSGKIAQKFTRNKGVNPSFWGGFAGIATFRMERPPMDGLRAVRPFPKC